MKNIDLYREAIRQWGADAQTLMVFEEMSELQKELCKCARGKQNKKEIAEEIADVMIMLEQMMVLHECEAEVARYKIEKLKRLEHRVYGVIAPGSNMQQEFQHRYCDLCTSLVCGGIIDEEGREGCLDFRRWRQQHTMCGR